MMLMRCLLPMFLSFALINSVSAQAIRSATVFAEEDTDSNKKCQFSNASGVAAIEAALRYNRVELSSKLNEVKFYFTLTNTEIDSVSCSLALKFHVFVYSNVTIPNSQKKYFAKALLCEQGGGGMFNKYEMQSRVNSILKENVDICISQVNKESN